MKKLQYVTVSVPALKKAFRKAHPGQTAPDLAPAWLQFWAAVAANGKVETVEVKTDQGPSLFEDPLLEDVTGPKDNPEKAEEELVPMGAFEKIPPVE